MYLIFQVYPVHFPGDSSTGPSKEIAQSSSQAIDDFSPGETIDSEFLGKTENEVDARSRNSENESEDSDR